MRSQQMRRAAGMAAFGALLVLLAQPVAAVPMPVQFLEMGTSPTGMDPSGFPMPVDVNLPLTADIRPVVTGSVADGLGLSVANCFIINESPGAGCQLAQPVGSSGFTLVVDITVLSVPNDVTASGSTPLIFFSAMPPVPTYGVSDVSVIVDPDPIAGFTFTPFTALDFALSPTMTYYYLGFFLDLGESATFRVDVTGDHSGAGMPLAFAANGWVVPEPGTAVLMGAGLLLLARRRSR